jgi:hypothetical protein
VTPLFHPRRHHWNDHFRWDGIHIVGKSAVGRTTNRVLGMNCDEQLELRMAGESMKAMTMKGDRTMRKAPQKWLWRPATVRPGGVAPPVFSPKGKIPRPIWGSLPTNLPRFEATKFLFRLANSIKI